VLFHRVANTLNYLDIKNDHRLLRHLHGPAREVSTSSKIFPGCRLLDIHEYLLEKGVKLDGIAGSRYLYHDPCHAPMRHDAGNQGGQPADGGRRWS
jgi:hypothetical protein